MVPHPRRPPLPQAPAAAAAEAPPSPSPGPRPIMENCNIGIHVTGKGDIKNCHIIYGGCGPSKDGFGGLKSDDLPHAPPSPSLGYGPIMKDCNVGVNVIGGDLTNCVVYVGEGRDPSGDEFFEQKRFKKSNNTLKALDLAHAHGHIRGFDAAVKAEVQDVKTWSLDIEKKLKRKFRKSVKRNDVDTNPSAEKEDDKKARTEEPTPTTTFPSVNGDIAIASALKTSSLLMANDVKM